MTANLMIVGGSFGLKYFAELRYTFSTKKRITNEEAAKLGVSLKHESEVDIEKQYENLKEADIDQWQNIRGPRPWEDSKTVQAEQRTGMNKLST